ncbi:MAG: DUF4212 domain-containing protein [bacterium]
MVSNQNSPGSNASTLPPDLHRPEVHALLDRYWRTNVITMVILLAIWAFIGLGCGILFADWLNQFNLPGTGYPLGFWFAQQGSIITFVLLILVYCLLLNRLDAKHHAELKQLYAKGRANA